MVALRDIVAKVIDILGNGTGWKTPGLKVDVLIVPMEDEGFCIFHATFSARILYPPGWRFFGNVPVHVQVWKENTIAYFGSHAPPILRISYEQRSCFHFP